MADVPAGRLRGVLIIESFRPTARLTDLGITVDAITRIRPESVTSGQPDIWTLIDFEATDVAARRLSSIFADTLQPGPWYVDFHTVDTTYVVFAGRVFRYRHGDADARSAAAAHGRAAGVPEAQLDWG
ncbi:hypothetical protein [Nocardia nova]|uniref:hypothetical protein n=1 Tax=Nocardia nova TaxID=37330 RepID=UPI0033F19B7E